MELQRGGRNKTELFRHMPEEVGIGIARAIIMGLGVGLMTVLVSIVTLFVLTQKLISKYILRPESPSVISYGISMAVLFGIFLVLSYRPY